MSQALLQRVSSQAASVRVDESDFGLSGRNRHEEWFTTLEVGDVVSANDRAGAAGSQQIDPPPLTELVDPGTRLSGEFPVQTCVARNEHVCPHTATDLLSDELVDGALSTPDVHGPKDVHNARLMPRVARRSTIARSVGGSDGIYHIAHRHG